MPLKSINALTLKSLIEHGEALLIDVREPMEHEALRTTSIILTAV